MAALAIAPEVEKIPTALKQVGVRRDYQMINPRLIDVEPGFNPRNYDLPENREHIDGLKRSIGERGLLLPLVVRFNVESGRATLVDGECRLRSIMELIAEGNVLASETDVPCFPAPKGSNDESARLLDAITANTGKPLSKWELGSAFARLYNFGLSPEKIAARTGYTERFIREAIELSEAPEEVKTLLSQKSITPSLALATLRINGSEATAILKQKVVEAKSTGQTTAKRAKAKDESKNVSSLVLYAAEEMAKALDVWREDATAAAETALVEAHKAYRKLIRAPKQEEAA
jgi:ParB-like chromosome segregation protein Spo0J